MESNEQAQQQGGGGDNNKIAQQFQETMNDLIAILGGEKKLKVSKRVPNDRLGKIVDELLSEQTAATEKQVKEDLKNLLDSHVKYENEVRKSEEDLAKLKTQKKKEFIEAAKAVFKKVENLAGIRENYKASLGKAADGVVASGESEEKPA